MTLHKYSNPSLVIFIIFLLFFGSVFMYKKQYQMVVLITPDSESYSEWPSKKNGLMQVRGLKNRNILK